MIIRTPTRRVRRALALAGTVLATSVTSAAPAWADSPIEPGAPFCRISEDPVAPSDCDSQNGTLGFVLRDDRGALYITGPAHGFYCGKQGIDCQQSGTKERALSPTIDEFGTVVIDDDSGFVDPANHPANPSGTDVALIKIDPTKYGSVDPSVREIGGPTRVLSFGEGQMFDRVEMYGQGSYGTPDKPEPALGRRGGKLDLKTGIRFLATELMAQEGNGDSGSPYVHAHTGAALGLNANCACSGEFGYPTLVHVLTRFQTFGYTLSLVTAKYDPD